MSETILLSKPYSVRLPVDVAGRFEESAQQANVRVSDVLRAALSGRGDIVIHEQDSESKARRAKLMRMLGNAGNNLNQIARYLNEYGAPYNALSGEVRAAIADLAALKYEVLQKVGDAVGNTQAYQL